MNVHKCIHTEIFEYAYICVHADKCMIQKHTHMRFKDTCACTKHKRTQNKALHINPASYSISLARSVRVCLQQQCHYLWPGLVRHCMMQRQCAPLERVCVREREKESVCILMCICLCMCDAHMPSRGTSKQTHKYTYSSAIIDICVYNSCEETRTEFHSSKLLQSLTTSLPKRIPQTHS